MGRRLDIGDAPTRLNMQESLTWIRAYEVSKYLYSEVEEWHDLDNEIVANRIIADAYHRKRKQLSFGRPSMLLDPGRETVALGTMTDLHVWDPHRETIRVFEYSLKSAPPLIWSMKHKACYAIPGKKLPKPKYKATQFKKAYRTYRKWTRGKYPKGASEYFMPKIRVSAPMIAVAIGYRSDKFHDDGDFHNYIHHFEKGVMARVAPGKAYFVNGGRLVLTKDGLHR